VAGGAAMCGFNFFPPTPRSISVGEAAALMALVPDGVTTVAVVVDAEDSLLADIIDTAGVQMLQLHGHESVERVVEIREKFGLPVMNVLPVASAGDVAAARTYEPHVDRLMFDAKPPKGATRPGGNALAFDWELLSGESWSVPWTLAGGLTAENVADAVKTSGTQAVDTASGVEDAPGVKNPAKIRDFLDVVKSL